MKNRYLILSIWLLFTSLGCQAPSTSETTASSPDAPIPTEQLAATAGHVSRDEGNGDRVVHDESETAPAVIQPEVEPTPIPPAPTTPNWHKQHGWIAWDGHSDVIAGRPWQAHPQDQDKSFPPEGVLVSRKGGKSYVYDLAYPTSSNKD